ncbi:hypothetical protein Pmani_027325 [Petrolisthes manimaculis]|uniref:Chitin-binding type-4 domain-containing protein n=1 Tax=Petrolisthes manimaculis TaxID=1843537 RepID=A0AAE1P1U9_9EUCA|nr:hypothetical protein Pmani_027325 [Petrolisthes manimaculis]
MTVLLTYLVVVVVAMMCPARGQVLLYPPSRHCYEMGYVPEVGRPALPLPVFPAGEMMWVQAEVPGEGREGMFQFYLCPSARGDQQDCLIKIPVKIGGGSEVFDLSLLSDKGPYTIPIQLPSDLTCSTCTLMWEVVRRGCEEGEDPCFEERTTTCVDISVTEDNTSLEEPLIEN